MDNLHLFYFFYAISKFQLAPSYPSNAGRSMAVYQGLPTHQDIVVNMALEVIVKYDVIYKQAYDDSKFCEKSL